MKLGEKIKLVRKHRGLTQRELGERLHLDGNAANRIAQYESGFRTPKEDRIQEIARVLNVRKENFFTRAETPEDIILKDPTQCELLVETVCCVVFFISAKP